MLTMTSAAVTHRGRVRETNEDSVFVADRLVVVADGMGGHAAGEVASRIAVERMRELAAGPLQPDDVVAAVVDADRLIREDGAHTLGHAGMGTTLCGVALADAQTDDTSERCVVFNVGDSRVYSYGDGVLAQVSVDHSEVQELRDAGKLSEVAAALYPRRNVITRALGGAAGVTPDVWTLDPGPATRFLVCSDGLSGEVDDDEIASVLGAHTLAQDAADALLDTALTAGGHDNITVVVADVHSVAPRGGPVSATAQTTVQATGAG
ncbi:PP2C family protein-serine/threonine phosphatase [uncultured Jatrophihabitans sp.]|uniref:PP2C family protein-serine/threonine phosphatase n=1 Tax=uncultured Jatrophihabitans sp. TaxID=1610747 RepID=UPI0035C9F058